MYNTIIYSMYILHVVTLYEDSVVTFKTEYVGWCLQNVNTM